MHGVLKGDVWKASAHDYDDTYSLDKRLIIQLARYKLFKINMRVLVGGVSHRPRKVEANCCNFFFCPQP